MGRDESEDNHSRPAANHEVAEPLDRSIAHSNAATVLESVAL